MKLASLTRPSVPNLRVARLPNRLPPFLRGSPYFHPSPFHSANRAANAQMFSTMSRRNFKKFKPFSTHPYTSPAIPTFSKLTNNNYSPLAPSMRGSDPSTALVAQFVLRAVLSPHCAQVNFPSPNSPRSIPRRRISGRAIPRGFRKFRGLADGCASRRVGGVQFWHVYRLGRGIRRRGIRRQGIRHGGLSPPW